MVLETMKWIRPPGQLICPIIFSRSALLEYAIAEDAAQYYTEKVHHHAETVIFPVIGKKIWPLMAMRPNCGFLMRYNRT